MIRFLARRLLILPPALLLINFLGFAYALLAQQFNATRNPYVAPSGPPVPLGEAYAAYLQGALRLDFGRMPTGGGLPIGEVVQQTAGASLGLYVLALLLSLAVGLLLGLRAVRTEPAGVARWLVPFSTVGLAMPSFFLGSLLVAALVFYMLRGGVPPLPLQGFGWDAHLVLPVITLMLRPTVQIAHVTATQVSGELTKQYVTAARSLGFTWSKIRRRVALRNVLAPVILTIGGNMRAMLAELVIVEWLFLWPGLGRLLGWTLVSGPLSYRPGPGGALFLSPPVVATVLTVFAGLLLAIDLAASLLVRACDPRLRVVEADSGRR